MLTQVFARATCLSVRPTVTRQYCVKTKNASVAHESSFLTPNFIRTF